MLLVLPFTFAHGGSLPLKTTFNNPTPSAGANFGGTVAAFGTHRVLVGAEGANSASGKAYLFSRSGPLLTTFSNPAPGTGGFGAAVAAAGDTWVLIGDYNYVASASTLGRAYLFATNGALVTTFTNPEPARIQAFGWALAGLGSDRVLISGLVDANKPGPYLGGVYLFSFRGDLLAKFTDPFPSTQPGAFGVTVATLGPDRVLIGNPTAANDAGAVYLFSTNKDLQMTFTNPAPASGNSLGASLATVGRDRVLIGAPNGGAGGAAYLFHTNGTLLTTFTNSTPAADNFGLSVAALGEDRVVVGAYQDGAGAFQSGAAYVFSLQGTLLNTITNPTPAFRDWFGYAVAAVGSNEVLIGAVWDDTGATDSGSAYLFSLPGPIPPLSIERSSSSLSLSWVSDETGLILQELESLGAPAEWRDVTNSVATDGQTHRVLQSPNFVRQFFRLKRP